VVSVSPQPLGGRLDVDLERRQDARAVDDFSRPRRRVVTSRACSSTLRCFITPDQAVTCQAIGGVKAIVGAVRAIATDLASEYAAGQMAAEDLQRAAPRWAAAGPASRVPLPGPLSSARDRPWPMLGRDGELEAIASAWSRVGAGGRETVLVAGEPGAGKSRLIAEAGEAAHGAGALVLYGSGEDAVGTPYAPFVAALGHLDRHAGRPLLDELRGSPLGRLMPGTGTGEEHTQWSLGDDRGRLFAATVEALERLARRRPLLLAIDDLHGCGPSTLALVDHIARTPAQVRLLLLATYRPTDVDPEGELAAAIAGLRSAPGAQHLQLGGLDAGALRDIAAALEVADDAPALDRAATVAARESGGNPLFACELLRAMGEAGDADSGPALERTPRSLRMLIATRGHALGATAHEHLSAAAICGRSFAAPVVAAALGVETPAVVASTAHAERAGLIAIDPDGGCAFSHAVVARCLYEEVDPGRRGALHRRFAEILERDAEGAADERAGELARHWRGADPPDDGRAARWCAAAGNQALQRYDHEVAARWFEQALELHDRAGDKQPGGERCDLLIGLGEALRFSDQEQSRTTLLDAARLADRIDDVDRLVAAVLANHRGFVSHVGGFDRERGAMLRRAAERMTEAGPKLALVLAQLALELTFSPQVERRRRLAEQALATARASGDERVVAQVLIRCLIAQWGPENRRDRIAAAAESIAISARLDEPLDLFHALHWQAVAQVEVGELRAAAQTLREQERIAARVGDGTAIWLCECSASMHAALRGQLELGEQRAQHAAELAQRSAQPDALPFYISQIASIRWQQGRLAELAPLLAEALDQYPGLPAFRSLVTLAHALADDRAFAREVLVVDTSSGFAELPRDPIWIAAAATYAHAVAELGDRDAAAQLHPILEPHRGQLATTTISVSGLVDHALGRLELLLGEEAAGHASLGSAIADYAAMPAPLWRSQAERDLAGPDGSVPGSGWNARLRALGLTERQAEVVHLIARGHSNREVAAALHISPSTVKRHLENAYDRTGVRSRGALTALLLDEPDGPGR
jgi:DNA-binding CsgD family transcriptional regulator/tetratricopeptide (TPR) repeat protein